MNLGKQKLIVGLVAMAPLACVAIGDPDDRNVAGQIVGGPELEYCPDGERRSCGDHGYQSCNPDTSEYYGTCIRCPELDTPCDSVIAGCLDVYEYACEAEQDSEADPDLETGSTLNCPEEVSERDNACPCSESEWSADGSRYVAWEDPEPNLSGGSRACSEFDGLTGVMDGKCVKLQTYIVCNQSSGGVWVYCYNGSYARCDEDPVDDPSGPGDTDPVEEVTSGCDLDATAETLNQDPCDCDDDSGYETFRCVPADSSTCSVVEQVCRDGRWQTVDCTCDY